MLYSILKELNIPYEEVSHEEVLTIEQANQLDIDIEGVGCKCILMANKKGNYYLVFIEDTKRVDTKGLKKLLQEKHLSFASDEQLFDALKIKNGVTPMAIINDDKNAVKVCIDETLKNQKVLVHPNTASKTMSLLLEDLVRFIEHCNHEYLYF